MATTRSYHYSFGVYKQNPTTENNDEEAEVGFLDDDLTSTFTTVKFQFWKFYDCLNYVVKLGQKEFDICLGEVYAEDENLFETASDFIKDLSVPRVCCTMMATELMVYIQKKVIIDGFADERPIVFMDILEVDGSVEEALMPEEAWTRWVAESLERNLVWERSWNAVDVESSFGREVDYIVEEVISDEDVVEVEQNHTPDLNELEINLDEEERTRNVLSLRELIDIGTALLEEDNFLDEIEQLILGDAVHHSFVEYPLDMVPASEVAIAKLEKVLVGEVEGFSCVICMDDEEELGLSRMPCTHLFHTECVETWLRISSYCPLCKFVLN